MLVATPTEPVAVLYQALLPPMIDGIRKPKKPAGYSDSGADIAFALKEAGVPVVTPARDPDPEKAIDWVYPDTEAGIVSAIADGARTLWANTVLFRGHPIERLGDKRLNIVGQEPARVHIFDDKAVTNALLADHGCPVPASIIVCSMEGGPGLQASELTDNQIRACGLSFPLVLKPLRGRGSEGVVRIEDLTSLKTAASGLFAAEVEVKGETYPRYGDRLILEEYLPGQEVTITLMPPGEYVIDGKAAQKSRHWALPVIARFNHDSGVAPYSGVVAVTRNSRALGGAESEEPSMARLVSHTERAAELVGARAPIRIDCRCTEDGEYRLFDLNMKPNMTGPGRPGRDDQDSLTLLAAREIGWSYPTLLTNILSQAWPACSETN